MFTGHFIWALVKYSIILMDVGWGLSKISALVNSTSCDKLYLVLSSLY